MTYILLQLLRKLQRNVRAIATMSLCVDHVFMMLPTPNTNTFTIEIVVSLAQVRSPNLSQDAFLIGTQPFLHFNLASQDLIVNATVK